MTIVGDNRYEIVKQIGEGGMQQVFAAHDTLLDKFVALKIPKNESAIKRFERSAQMSARVNDRHVAKTLDYIDEDGKNYLVEELIEGTDLSLVLDHFPFGIDPYRVAAALHQIALGVAASHRREVVHRDLKPSNVMVVGSLNLDAFKITDFGIAKMAEAELDEAVEGGDESLTASQTAIGALPYMAPEMIASVKDASYPTDIWSVGAMTYELLSGKKPFGSGLRAVSKIERGEYDRDIPQISKQQFRPLGEQLLAIIEQCMRVNIADRPTAEKLVELCEELCYNNDVRIQGVVNAFRHNAWGFITLADRRSVFFHKESVYGRNSLAVGDEVLVSAYAGGGSDRAFPVLPMVSRRPE
jgi:eukaryotic-like serine/threonine-protein kinase